MEEMMNDSRTVVNPARQLPEKYEFTFGPKQLQDEYDYLAPDGSEIRLLVRGWRGSVAHCRLPAGSVSAAVAHRMVEEIWYCLSGQGEVWRSFSDKDTVIVFRPGTSLTIPPGTYFQFRNTGAEPLCILITSMPPWPGADEAVPVAGHW
jgi:mannose-6-phosphate isomerase-like protein (cupin superfamily)